MIFNLFKNNDKNNDSDENINLLKIVALLIHAAKIDENYTEREKKIINDFVNISLKNKENEYVLNFVKKAEVYESNSNQILEYTKEVKKMDIDSKKLILKTLWKIILSDNSSDVYESNLMRRICGLLYIPDKLSGEIKSAILNSEKK